MTCLDQVTRNHPTVMTEPDVHSSSIITADGKAYFLYECFKKGAP